MSDEPRKIIHFVIVPMDGDDDPALLRAVEEAMKSAPPSAEKRNDAFPGAIPPDAVRDEALEQEITESVNPKLEAIAHARREALAAAHHAMESAESAAEFVRIATAEATIAARIRLQRAVAKVNEHVTPVVLKSAGRIVEGLIVLYVAAEIAKLMG